MHRDRLSAKEKKRKSKGFWGSKRQRPSFRRILRCEGLEDRRLLAGDLNVVALTPTPSGFLAEFNQPVDTSILNLFDAASGALGPADISLTGQATGSIAGSAMIQGNQLRFVATGGVLPQDTYTVRLRSADNGLKALDGGALLDGEFSDAFPSGDGVAGGDFVFSFNAAPAAVVVGLPDFARGPAQPVNIPGAGDEQPAEHGLPIQISAAEGVTSLLLQLAYDPAMLRITDADVGIDAPEGSQVTVNLSVPGEATIAFFALEPLSGGAASVISLTANVPRNAPYGEVHSIRITSLEVNAGALAATADEAVHVVAFAGDANRNMRYDAEDARLISRVGVGLDSGLAVDPPHANPATPLRHLYPLVDATILGDVTGDGTLSALDASDLLRKAVGLPTPGIPALPENSAPVSISLSANTLPESEPVGTVVGILSTADPDEDDVHTYQLVSGTGSADNALFAIDGATLKTAAVLDFESQATYQIRVRSTDLLGLSVEQTLLVNVTDVNEAPTAVALTPNTIPENSPVGTVVGVLTSEDPDAGDTHTYSLVDGDGDDDNAAFVIDGDQLRTTVELDYETKNAYLVRVRSVDSDGLSFDQMLVVHVADVNEAPTAVSLSPDSVPENVEIGTVVGILTTEDPDAADTHTYSLVAGDGDDDNAAFIIDGDQLRSAVDLDFETKDTYLIRVISTDSGGLSVEQALVVTVTDVNEAPTAVSLSPGSVPEDAEIGTVVGVLASEDPDAGDSHTYSLVSGDGDDDNAAFTIDGDQLRTAVELDFETKDAYTIRVQSTDSGGLSVEQIVVVSVTDVNEAPSAVLLAPSSVSADTAVGDTIGQLTTTDPDLGDTHAYSLIEGDGDDDNASFEIDGDQLKLAVELDLTAQSTFQIRVLSTDSGGLSVEQVLTIVANQAPIAVSLSPDSVSEDAEIGDVVGVLATEDPDAGDSHTYSLVSGDGDDDNSAFTIDGDQLRTAVALDFETKDTYLVRVRSTDSGGLSVEQALVVTVTDVNEAPTAVSLSPDSVPDSAEIGTVVGVLATEDPDAGDSHTYSLVEGDGDDDNAAFIIDGDQLRTAVELDSATKDSYSIRVRSTDSGDLSVEQILVVNVTAVNEAPTSVSLSPDNVPENAEIGSVVGVLATEDPDAGDSHTYSLVSGDGDDDNSAFIVDGDQLRTAVELDFETKHTYSIRVQSTDAGGLSVEQALVVTVIDVNEQPEGIQLAPNIVSEGSVVGDVVGQLTTIDPDAGDTHEYSLVEGDGDDDNAAFEIDGQELKIAAELDLSSQTTYQIRVRSMDSGGLSVEQTLLVVANEAPSEVSLSPDSVPENVEIGTVVGEFTTDDPNAGDSHSYSLVEGDGDDDNAAFTIDGNQLRTAVELDFETKDTYSIRVRSTDAGGLSVEQALVIAVLNVNEAPVNQVPGPQTTEVNQPLTFSLVNGNAITISDVDAGDDSLTVQLAAEGGSLSETEFTGSLAELNALLNGLIFTPETDFVGDAFLDILTNDLGHNGLGGVQTASNRIAISVQ
ncbi:MAG: cadherin repeat domain-containing protein [Pirellulaceae bacterium]|nr:cadherin repeat domain-containing protein [Pirellulaceae bacterium]